MKRVISLFLSVVMLVSIIAWVDFSAYAVDNADETDFDIQVYFDNYQNKADNFNYLQYVSQHYTSDKVKNTIEFRINQETNCYNLVDYLKNNLWFKGNYAIWEAANFATNPSEIVGRQLNKETYYETIILRILNSSVTSDNAIDWLNQGAIKNSVKISKHITQASENSYYSYLANMHMPISDFTSEEYAKTIEFTKNYINSQGYKKFGKDVSFLSDVLSMSKDIEEYSEKLASYCQLIELGDAIADFLEEVKNNSDDKNLINAINEVIPIIKDSYIDMLKTAAKEGLYCIGSFALKKIVGDTWKKCLINLLNNGYLFDGTAIVGSVFLAIGITKTFTNIAFNVDAKLDKYELMKALCSFEQSMETAIHKKLNSFENTEEYAIVLLEGVSIVYQTYIIDTEIYSEMTRICQNDWIGNLSKDEYEKTIEICNYNKELYQSEYDSLKVVSGICGDALGWVITYDNELLIYGIGEMYDFEKEKAPWVSNKNSITTLYVSSFLSKVGAHAFENLTNVKNSIAFRKEITFNTNSIDGIKTTIIINGDVSFIGNHTLMSQIYISQSLNVFDYVDSEIHICDDASIFAIGNFRAVTKCVRFNKGHNSIFSVDKGARVVIKGDFLLEGNESNPDFHYANLYIDGDLSIGGDFTVNNCYRIYETLDSGYLKINGNANINNPAWGDGGEISAGIIEIKGNYNGVYRDYGGIVTLTGANTVILSGDKEQYITYLNASNLIINNCSEFGVVINKSSTVTGEISNLSSKLRNGKILYLNGGSFADEIYVGDISIKGNINVSRNLNIIGNLYAFDHGASTICLLNEAIVNVKGNAELETKINSYLEGGSNSVFDVQEGTRFIVEGDLLLRGNECNPAFCNATLKIGGEVCVLGNFMVENCYTIYQENESSYLKVNNMVINSHYWGGNPYSKMSAGTLAISGNFKGYLESTDRHTIIFNGNEVQVFSNNCKVSNIIINSDNGILFSSPINVTTQFNHNGNPFTLYNNGKGSSFPDYDGDGYNDNVDPYPLVKHPDKHNYVFAKTVAPTCVEKGYDAYICDYCNGVDKRNLVDMIPHNYIFSETISPTCTTQGYDLYICSQCNGNEKRNYTNKIAHEYEYTKTVAPTCTAQGYDLYTCSGCNSTEKRNTVSSTGHNYEVTSNTATCTDAGVKTTVCSKCGDIKTSNVSALGHSYNKVYTAPTCTESGGYTNTCTRCGDITYNVYEKSGHDYGECVGQDYINKISGSTISAVPNYFNEFYHTSSSIGSTSQVAFSSTNIAVPNEVRLNINNIEKIVDYQFAVYGGLFSRKSCSGIFAYDKNTGREPEQSAIPYTDKDGNLVNMKYVDYKVDGEWVNGEYTIDGNNVIDVSGTVVSTEFTDTRPHIVYTRNEAIANGVLNDDGTVNVSLETVEGLGVSFSAGIPGVYFTPTHITSSNSRKFIDVFEYDENADSSIETGKYDIDICFYNTSNSGLASTTFKIYDNNVFQKQTGENEYELTCIDCGEKHTETVDKSALIAAQDKFAEFSSEDYSTKSFEKLQKVCESYKYIENSYASQEKCDASVTEILEAIYDLEPYLNFTVSAKNGSYEVACDGNISSDNKYSLLFGAELTLSATANEGYEFVGWYDVTNSLYFSTNSTYTFKLTENTNLKAVFVKEQSATLTFTTYSNWVQSIVTKTIDEWNNVTSIEDLLPQVPYKYGYSNGRWVYDNDEVLAKLRAGESVFLIPEYDEDDLSLPTPREPENGVPALDLYYKLDADANVGSFVMAAGIPDDCQIESVGVAFYYKKANEFDPTKFELLINNKMLVSRFNTKEIEDIYIVNMNKLTSTYNWAVRGYVTYYDTDGNLKTAYSNQVNIIDREQV